MYKTGVQKTCTPHRCTHSVQWHVNTHTPIGYSITVDLELYYHFCYKIMTAIYIMAALIPSQSRNLTLPFIPLALTGKSMLSLEVCFAHS